MDGGKKHGQTILSSLQILARKLPSSVYNFLHAWFGTGLLTSTGKSSILELKVHIDYRLKPTQSSKAGEKWQKRRKILTPAFHFNVLERYLTITVENSERAVQSLRAKGECVQDLVQFLTQYTLNIICEAAMGASLSGKEESQKKYRKAVHDMGTAFVNVNVGKAVALYSSWTFGCTAAGRMQADALKILHRFTENIIAERKEFHEKTDGRFLKNIVSKSSGADDEAVENEELHGYRKKRMAMLDLLIAAHRDGQRIDELGIREEVDTFMLEGHDTSAMGLCFALLLIAEHKDVQERIRQEVNEVLKNADGKLEMSELNKFNYLERVIKESLRLYPSVPFISRNITEDMQLKDYLIPRGTLVDVRIYLIHRDPKHWPDPLKFDPDRFLPERIQGRHPFSYIPFSAGPQICYDGTEGFPGSHCEKFHLGADRFRSRGADFTRHSAATCSIGPRKICAYCREMKVMAYYYLLTVLLGLAGLLFHFYVQLFSRTGKLVNKIPGPTPIPFFGNLLELHVPLVEINNALRKWSKIYYPIYRLWFGPKAVTFILHPDDLEIMLTSSKHINKQFAYEHFHLWLHSGLLTSNGQKWHHRRKILTPAFHFNILQKYIEITNEEGERAVKNIRSTSKETKVDLLPFCSKYTLNIICESVMGVPLDGDHKDKEASNKYKNAVYRMGNIIFFRLVRPYIWDWMVPFIPKHNREVKEVLANLNNFTDKIVEERRKYHASTNYQYLNFEKSEVNAYIGKSKRLAMLDLLLAAERDGKIDDEGIKEEVSTFIFEGHDTTAMSMCFTIMLLAENKHCQDLAREEVEIILGPKNGQVETTDLHHMNYLERCIKESLRLFPSVPSVTRHLHEDVQLKNYKIPAGVNIIMHFIDVHRDPNFWPEPEKFDPDRFLPEEIAKRHNFAYIPFSAGSRNCIGQKFAMMELKSLISHILYNFHLEPIDYTRDVKLISDVVIRPSKPVYTKFVRIDRQSSI
ncbi:hypothetical protein TSAR_012651 [Trichomalopsis sarcophagae]|uniref:Cytochrome P450 n=1 Tax=Trichomalopsis sarcophagae TaxID=543379 RepID=A0A232FKJ9_9HYME|nr:hypothetical protein TSAR_012651 [Trichomalopsis sarcophagae]